MSSQRTHDGLVLVDTQTPFEVRKFPTVSPKGDEILVNVKWTAATPLDLHQADGGVLVEYPMRTGSTGAGIIVEIGPDVKHFKVGDRVFGFAHQKPEWRTHQEYATAPEWVFGKIPEGISFEEAVTLPENLVTAFNTISTDLKLPTPWPKPADYQPPRAHEHILIWGRGVLGRTTYYPSAAILRVQAHQVYDYRSPTVVEDLLKSAQGREAPAFPLIVDCIGSQQGTLAPVSKLAQSGSTVAVMLPVILKHASNETKPEYSMDASTSIEWAPGVNVCGVRTHFYWKNEMFREKLQTEIIPALLQQGVVKPNRYRIVEGETLLERAKKSLDAMREGASGEKIIWRVSNE
ncbi:hypothetical protein CHU98_g3430 [Xylaria longipes]|nr:hypothetical protein CHU98_g3430 [Xylaria longipes]